MLYRQFKHPSASLRKTFLVMFSALITVVIVLFLIFLSLNQQQLNNYFSSSIEDTTMLLDKSIDLHSQQMKAEFGSVSTKALQIHRKFEQILQESQDPKQGLIEAFKREAEERLGSPVEVNLIDDQFKIFRSTFSPEVGLDLDKIPSASRALSDARQGDGIKLDLPVFEPSSQLFRAYTLSHVRNGGFFIQLAIRLTDYNKFFATLQEIKQKSTLIKEVEIYMIEQDYHQKPYIASFSNSKHTLTGEEKDLVLKLLESQTLTTVIQNDRGDVRDYYRVVISDWCKVHNCPDFHSVLIYRFRLDLSTQRNFIKNTILFAGLFLLLICGGILVGWRHLQRSLVTPVDEMVANIQNSESIQSLTTEKSVKELVFIANSYNHHLLEIRIINEDLHLKNNQLQASLDEIKTLSGLLPMCSNCHKIRDDQGYWTRVEQYISQHLAVDISHGICPDCVKELYPEAHAKLISKKTST
ncbi:hypothetical protein KAI46_08300 [bacterium]|nr:hypothetical protein [bacterium]